MASQPKVNTAAAAASDDNAAPALLNCMVLVALLLLGVSSAGVSLVDDVFCACSGL